MRSCCVGTAIDGSVRSDVCEYASCSSEGQERESAEEMGEGRGSSRGVISTSSVRQASIFGHCRGPDILKMSPAMRKS